MQKIATRIFMVASLVFGVLGIVLVLTTPEGEPDSGFTMVLTRSLMVTVFIILPSFALSVAGKYLDGKISRT